MLPVPSVDTLTVEAVIEGGAWIALETWYVPNADVTPITGRPHLRRCEKHVDKIIAAYRYRPREISKMEI